jgi:shikimate dehydrogenase
MMSHWIEAADLNAIYAPVALPPDAAADILTQISATSLAGLNITLPHKETALAIAHEATPRARAIGAANLLTFHEGRIHADNTDGEGFLAAIDRGVFDETEEGLVLGAGGASRAILHALSEAGMKRFTLSNRDRSRAERLAAGLAPGARILDWGERDAGLAEASLVINATSLGMAGREDLEMDWTQASRRLTVFDSVYTPLETGFLAAARAAGHMGKDGLDMLIGQGRPSFQAFFDAPTPEMDIRSILVAALEGEA